VMTAHGVSARVMTAHGASALIDQSERVRVNGNVAHTLSAQRGLVDVGW